MTSRPPVRHTCAALCGMWGLVRPFFLTPLSPWLRLQVPRLRDVVLGCRCCFLMRLFLCLVRGRQFDVANRGHLSTFLACSVWLCLHRVVAWWAFADVESLHESQKKFMASVRELVLDPCMTPEAWKRVVGHTNLRFVTTGFDGTEVELFPGGRSVHVPWTSRHECVRQNHSSKRALCVVSRGEHSVLSQQTHRALEWVLDFSSCSVHDALSELLQRTPYIFLWKCCVVGEAVAAGARQLFLVPA